MRQSSVSKKSFRHAVRIFKLSKKFKNTCRLNAKGAFCPLHTSPAALSQTSSARFFDSLRLSLNETAQRAPTGRMHHRRPHPVGADAHIGPLGIDIKSAIADRTHRRGAHGASGTGYDLRRAGGRCTWFRRHVGMPPYARSGWRTAMHTGGQRTRDARPYGERNHRTPARIGSRAGRPYRPPLRVFCIFPGCLYVEAALFYAVPFRMATLMTPSRRCSKRS